MSASPPLLTIGIPSFERHEGLVRLLDGIARERRAAGGLPQLDVLVSDNASADGTEREGRARAQAGEIRYQRHPENLGFERNLESVLRAARGEYVWLMGDDDRVSPGFLPELLALLQAERPALLIAPDCTEGDPDSRCAAADWGVRERTRAPLGVLLAELGLFGLLGGIGRTIFRRAGLRGLQLFLPLQTRFPHVFVVAHSFAAEQATVLARPAFIVPRMTPAEGERYRARWSAEDLWVQGWLRSMQATLRLLDCGQLPTPLRPGFFRMMRGQDWPLHFHVYSALAQQLFTRGARLAPREWQELARFDALLGAPAYSRRLEALRHAAELREIASGFCLELCRSPEPLFGPR